MIAHIRVSDGEEQCAAVHCENVERLAAENGKKVGLGNCAKLCGIMHDMGKFTRAFSDYISGKRCQKVYHSPTGAIYVYDNFFKGNDMEKMSAQIVSMVIRGHHGGLLDCCNTDGNSPYYESITQDKNVLFYDEAVENFLSDCRSPAELEKLMNEAKKEIADKLSQIADLKYTAGMIARFLLSCVVDADRWDAACFEYGINPFQEKEKTDWGTLLQKIEHFLEEKESNSEIGGIRRTISEYCSRKGESQRGIFSLSVPTGGGKTLSSLRFALKHIYTNDMDRIFYVVPYNTVLEQNSEDIKEALGNFDGILEHFGNFFGDNDVEDNVDGEILTERWDSPVIITSMVQFLNTAYKKSNTNARRFCRMANSVIIFDEIQALPIKCTVLFEKLVSFLHEVLNCSIILCTATQPNLKLTAEPIIPLNECKKIHEKLKRVRFESRIVQKGDRCDNEEAAIRLANLADEFGSVLMITNTKKAAFDIFSKARNRIPEGVSLIHLSTSMYPQHRTEKIKLMKELLLAKKPVVCVSTALIEAGVNISFPCVVRSLAGLSNIIQSAGRCNRHMEAGKEGGKVEIWYLAEENLANLEEIRIRQDCTMCVQNKYDNLNDSEEQTNYYFENERKNNGNQILYPYKGKYMLSNMIGENNNLKRNCRKIDGKLVLYQAFAEIGENFEVIDEDTISVITAYGEGKNIVTELNGKPDFKITRELIKNAQKYSVSIYKSQFKKMEEEGMIYALNCGVYVLREEYYDDIFGINFNSKEMDYLGY